MSHIENVNPTRLQWCCEQVGISADALAQSVGVPLKNIQKAMNGAPGLTFIQLRKVADFFGRGVLFFLESGDVEEEKVYSPQFRTLHNQKTELSKQVQGLIQNTERQRDLYRELQLELGDKTKFSVPDELSVQRMDEAAVKTRKWLGLGGEGSFKEYRQAVEAKGILVFRSNGYAGRWQVPKEDPICGFTLFDRDYPLIFVRKHKAETRQTFTLFHELAHLLLHRTSFIDAYSDLTSHEGKERQANEFAARVLVPDDEVAKIDLSKRPTDVSEIDAWLKPIRRRLGVSSHVLLLRLASQKRLSSDVYEAYSKWSSQAVWEEKPGGNRGYRHREPVHLFGKRFVGTVLQSLSEKRITLARASTYLDGIKTSDVHKLEGVYADI